MEAVTERNDHEAGVDANALRELDLNATASNADSCQTKDQNTEPKDTGEGNVAAKEGGMYDDLDNAAQDEDDPSQTTLTAGRVPKRKSKKKKPKSQRGLV